MSGSKKLGGSGNSRWTYRWVVMWSLPHTESNPSRSQSSAMGRMSAGAANGTGYIMPSMQVGMWTPNLTRGSSTTAPARRR